VFVIGGLTASASGYGWLAALLVLAGIVLFLAIMAPLWTTEIGVTTQRFVFKRGLVWRTTHELQLRAIEEVNLEQGLLGRILDFGQLQLHGTGVDDIRLPSLADPLALRKALQDGMASAAQSGMVATPGPPPRQEVSHCAA
jgi:uncharacterized membrane protein YdbT with pleckstrin-like domain